MSDLIFEYTKDMALMVSFKKQPALLKEKTDERLAVLDQYYKLVLPLKDRLQLFPKLCQEILDTIEKDCTYLSIFRMSRLLKEIEKFEHKEKQILEQLYTIADSPRVTREWTDGIKAQVTCWRKEISNQTLCDLVGFMESLLKDVQNKIYELGREARLEREIVQKEEEKQRLIDREKRRLEGVKEEELDKEEKKKRAMESIYQQFKKRKK